MPHSSFTLTLEQARSVAFPTNASFMHEVDGIAGLHDTVHVVGDDHGRHPIFPRDVQNELIYDNRGLGVQSGIGLIAKQIFRVSSQWLERCRHAFAFPRCTLQDNGASHPAAQHAPNTRQNGVRFLRQKAN